MQLGITGRIARSAARRPWLTVAVWIGVLTGALVMAGQLDDALNQDEGTQIQDESHRAEDLDTQYRQAGPDVPAEILIVESDSASFGDPSFDSVLDRAVVAASGVDGVTGVRAPSADAPFPVSADGRTALVSVELDPAGEGVVEDLITAVEGVSEDGYTLSLYGDGSVEIAFDTLASDTLARGEVIGVGIALVILTVVFGALAAAGVPILLAVVAILTAVGATAVVGQLMDLSFFVMNMITMIGLALGIDYTLVMVQRYREERAHGLAVPDAVAVAGNTANRAVFISGLTVTVSLVGLTVFPSTILRSLGTGAILAALSAVAAALTLLPAVLRLLGDRVDKGRVPTAHPGREPRFWLGVARRVLRFPALSAAVGAGLLVTIAIPALSMRLGSTGVESLPSGNSVRHGVEVLVDEFGYGRTATTVAIENLDGADPAIERLRAAIEDDPGFAASAVDDRGGAVFIDTTDTYDVADVRGEQAVERLRGTIIPSALAGTGAVAVVGGEQAQTIDERQLVFDYTPVALAITLGAAFVLLLVMFRSIVVPITSILLNLLSMSAAYGILVGVFQKGWGSDLFGFQQVPVITWWLPPLQFAVLFGLSMDYHVFLLSRVKEEYGVLGDTRQAVVHGLSRTGALIIGAALIVVAVFAGFATGGLAEFQQMGFGVGAAVILDATVVRILLVPALLVLLGRANWYLPSWLGWLPQVRMEGARRPLLGEPDVEREPESALV